MENLLSRLRERAAGKPKRIVYPEGDDARVLRAAREIVDAGMARPIVVGDANKVSDSAKVAGIRLSGIEIVEPSKERQEHYANLLLPDWKSRGVLRSKL